MYRQHQRNANIKLGMLCFVAKQLHADKAAQTSADGSYTHQRTFRDPPGTAHGFLFVHKHKYEPQRIDYNEIQIQVFHRFFLSGGVVLRKWMLLLVLCSVLWGCAAAPTFETLGPDIHEPFISLKEASAIIPSDAEMFSGQDGTLWVCNGFDLHMQTLPGGDVNATVQTMSGFSSQDLTVMTSASDAITCYEWVWTAMSDEGELICRGAILDDGAYHYCLTATAPAEKGSSLSQQWNAIFSSFTVN